MVAQCGKTFLLQIDISTVMTTIAGLQTRSMKINNEAVEVTNDNSNGWKELLSGCGVKSFSISGAGIFTDAATDAEINTVIMSGAVDTFDIVVPDFGTYSGDFLITEYEFSGEHNGTVQFSISLESSGAIAFVAV